MLGALLAATVLASSPAPAATGGDTFPTIVCRAQRPAPGTPLDPYRCSHWKELWPR